MAGLCAPLSTLRRSPRGPLRMTRGRCGSLFLHRKGLAPSTPRRSPGASHILPIDRCRVGAWIFSKAKGRAMSKNTICLWYDKDAEGAARFYAATFPDSAVGAVHHAPSDYPGGKKGNVLTVEFTVLGIPCLGLNGGPVFKHNEAFSFQIATEDQE